MATRAVGIVALALVTLCVQASGASAATSSGGASIRVAPSSAIQGGTVVIFGSVPVSGPASCGAGEAVQLTSSSALFPPDGFGPQAPRNAFGGFSATYVVPLSTPAGTYNIGVRCGGGNVGVSATLQVTATLSGASIRVAPSSAPQGSPIVIVGIVPVSGPASCAAGEAAQLTSSSALFPPDGFGPQAPRNAFGGFSATYVVPLSTPAGTYNIGVRCGGGNVGISATLHVTSRPTPGQQQ